MERVHVENDNMIVLKVSKDFYWAQKNLSCCSGYIYHLVHPVTITKLIFKMELL